MRRERADNDRGGMYRQMGKMPVTGSDIFYFCTSKHDNLQWILLAVRSFPIHLNWNC